MTTKAVVIIWLALLMIRKTGQKNTLYLADDQEGYVGVHYDAKQIGKTAVATTDLGPSGFIQIDNVRYQALARGTYIDKGTEVIVVGGQGAHLIVKQKEN